MTQAIHDVEIFIGIEGDARRSVELPRVGTVLTPGADVFAFPVKCHDAMQKFIGDVEVFLAIGDDSDGPRELSVPFSVAAHRPAVFVIDGIFPYHRGAIAAAHDI